MLVVDGFTYPTRTRYKQRDSFVKDVVVVGDYHRTNWVLATYKLLNKYPSVHEGDDIVGMGFDCGGHDVLAIANGTVIHSELVPDSTWYNMITIKHTLLNGFNIYSRYAHLRDRLVEVGADVLKGQLIGHIGGRERGMPNHLHFAICVTDLLVHEPRNWPSLTMDEHRAKAFIRMHYLDPLFYIDSQIAMQPKEPEPPIIVIPDEDENVTPVEMYVKNTAGYDGANFRPVYNTSLKEFRYLLNGTKVLAYDLYHDAGGQRWRLIEQGGDKGWMWAKYITDTAPV